MHSFVQEKGKIGLFLLVIEELGICIDIRGLRTVS